MMTGFEQTLLDFFVTIVLSSFLSSTVSSLLSFEGISFSSFLVLDAIVTGAFSLLFSVSFSLVTVLCLSNLLDLTF